MKIAIIGGTRPDWLKIYPLLDVLKRDFNLILIDTQQGKDFTHQVFEHLKFNPDYKLDCMRKDQNLESFLKLSIPSIISVLLKEDPYFVLVQGDTMTALAGAIAGLYLGCRIIHLEAGIRSFDLSYPYPEEMIRYIIDHMSDVLFTPTDFTRGNLRDEGIIKNVFRVGNTIVDLISRENILEDGKSDKKRILVTVHRRDNFGKPLQNICSAIKWLAEKYVDLVEFVIPVHLNPHVQSVVYSELGSLSNVDLKPPMDYWIFLSTLKSSYLVLTDSGGVQEETCSFGVPALVLREKTDRQESVKAGFARVVGTDPAMIIKNVEELLFDESKYKRMKALYNPYGDGKASERIHDILNDLVKRRQI